MKILYEDNHLLFVEKPVNMPVQGDASGDLCLTDALKAMIKQRDQKPGDVYLALVHRLDRPVGGAMVFCKTGKAAQRVSRAIAQNQMRKIYLAVTDAGAEEQATLRNALLKDGRTNRVRVCAPGTPGSKDAELSYETLARKEGLSLIRVSLKTGRSHQIRVQLAHSGHPLWGDNRYGNGKPGQQIALWSSCIMLEHPVKKEPLCVTCPPPAVFPWNLFKAYAK